MSANRHRQNFRLSCLIQLFMVLLYSGAAAAQTVFPAPENESADMWYESGQAELQRALTVTPNTNQARNVILIIGDGMGISTITAARILDGQKKGSAGEENFLSFEQFPGMALAKTYNTNQQTSDSAGTMTAMMSGIKTRAGVIGVNQNVDRADCASSIGNEVPTLLQQAASRGMATGIVTNTRITHATPAATFAHSPERNWESDADMPPEAIAQGCRDIAAQMIEFDYGSGINVALGGGLSAFLPEAQADPLTGASGSRRDGRDLTREWQARYDNSAFVWDASQLRNIDTGATRHLLGLFNRSHLSYRVDRDTPDAEEPSLPLMTEIAIRLLQEQDTGYFLMIESGRIDHAHHAGNAYRALDDTRELSEAVQTALDLTSDDDTLIIVTADHSHTLTIAGYPTRGNSILDTVVVNNAAGHAHDHPYLAADNQPYTTLGYRNGLGFAENAGGDTRYALPGNPGRQDLSSVDTTHMNFHQEALVPLESETHAGEDVPIYAKGPWSHLFHTTHEQHYVYHVMRHALGW